MRQSKIISVLLTLALFVSLLPAASALEAETGNIRTVVITGTPRLPVISVKVPSTGKVFINPYGLAVDMGWGEDESGQIISTPGCIENRSEVPLLVDVSVSSSVREGSDMILSSTSTKGTDSTTKKAFIYFEIKAVGTNDPYEVRWDRTFDSEKHIILGNGATKAKKEFLTLDPMTLDGETGKVGCAAFRLTGDAVRNPDTPWTDKDGVDVSVSFTFTPLDFLS